MKSGQNFQSGISSSAFSYRPINDSSFNTANQQAIYNKPPLLQKSSFNIENRKPSPAQHQQIKQSLVDSADQYNDTSYGGRGGSSQTISPGKSQSKQTTLNFNDKKTLLGFKKTEVVGMKSSSSKFVSQNQQKQQANN